MEATEETFNCTRVSIAEALHSTVGKESSQGWLSGERDVHTAWLMEE